MKPCWLFFCFCFFTLCLQAVNSSLWKNTIASFDSLTNRLDRVEKRNSLDSIGLMSVLNRMDSLAVQHNNSAMKARVLYWKASTIGLSDIKKSLGLVEQALTVVDSIDYKYDYYRLLALKSNLLLNAGDYYVSFVLCNRLIPYFMTVGDWEMKAVCEGNIGLIYLFVEDYPEALRYLEQARNWFSANRLINPSILAGQQIAYAYECTGRRQEALDLLRSILSAFPPHGSRAIEFYCLSSYCRLLPEGSERDSCVRRSVAVADESGDWQCAMSARKNMADWFFEKNQTDSALYYARMVYLESEKNVLKFGKRGEVCELLAEIYGHQQHWQAAYQLKRQADAYRDSIQGTRVKENIQKEKVRQEIVRYTFRLRELELQQQQHLRITWIVAISMTLLLLLLLVIIYLLRKRAVEEKELREMEKLELTSKIDDEMDKVDTKNRELSSSMLLLMTKNQQIRDLLAFVSQESEKGDIVKQTAGQLRGRLQEILREENDWEQFKLHFEQVHPAFFKRLTELHPDLTDNELRLCAYCKINISNKQIAQMLSVQPQTVIIARYRMRKKMNLEKDISLDEYLRQI